MLSSGHQLPNNKGIVYRMFIVRGNPYTIEILFVIFFLPLVFLLDFCLPLLFISLEPEAIINLAVPFTFPPFCCCCCCCPAVVVFWAIDIKGLFFSRGVLEMIKLLTTTRSVALVVPAAGEYKIARVIFF